MNQSKLVTAVTVGLILTGCRSLQSSRRVSELNCDSPSKTSISQQSKQIDIEIKVDKTPSMQGFANVKNSRYSYALTLLNDAATLGSANKTDYYVFGKTQKKINKDDYLNLKLPQSYQDNNSNFLSTQIHNAISKFQPNKITVIITDLYQDRSDINQITRVIKNNYHIAPDYAVGIIAMRSEFDGTIYDVGSNADKFIYKTNPSKINEFRPFYVLILGTHNNVKNYLDKFQKYDDKKIFNKEEKFLYNLNVFSLKSVHRSSFLSIKDETSKLRGLKRQKVMWINSPNGNQKLYEQEKIQLLGITENNNESKISNQTVYYYPLPHTFNIAQEEPFLSNISVGIFSNEKNGFNFDKNENALKEKITLSDWKIENNQIMFTTNFLSKEISKGTYLFKVDLIPRNFQVPEWWTIWNTDDDSNKNGAKTNNLNHFLTSLKEVTQEIIKSQETAIGRLCYVIQKN